MSGNNNIQNVNNTIRQGADRQQGNVVNQAAVGGSQQGVVQAGGERSQELNQAQTIASNQVGRINRRPMGAPRTIETPSIEEQFNTLLDDIEGLPLHAIRNNINQLLTGLQTEQAKSQDNSDKTKELSDLAKEFATIHDSIETISKNISAIKKNPDNQSLELRKESLENQIVSQLCNSLQGLYNPLKKTYKYCNFSSDSTCRLVMPFKSLISHNQIILAIAVHNNFADLIREAAKLDLIPTYGALERLKTIISDLPEVAEDLNNASIATFEQAIQVALNTGNYDNLHLFADIVDLALICGLADVLETCWRRKQAVTNDNNTILQNFKQHLNNLNKQPLDPKHQNTNSLNQCIQTLYNNCDNYPLKIILNALYNQRKWEKLREKAFEIKVSAGVNLVHSLLNTPNNQSLLMNINELLQTLFPATQPDNWTCRRL